MDRSHHLGSLQHSIMRVLWEREEATVAEVHAALDTDQPKALTTVATMLSKLEKKGVVAHRRDGRQFVYRPLVTEMDVRRSMISGLAEQLFDGNVTELVSHLIDEQGIDSGELDALKRLIAERAERDGDDV
ncbi:BlaI/MecI/CopY family transcriptional regulator [Engelhardtia mirabilis]|uniref:Methicillin resistance regulatory protein MecI n=1 Tax=Engelhardtia mirabilis TaxID=2528011 RepID=A0A518BN78_9BACT|nr:Methicillin resistance regulatory protein MecI [Planctomycetes bacterium Pla133]QDV02763.1 Methicillin resistance regulatory protein MecI [Planctomycetes bacterium Pla86]